MKLMFCHTYCRKLLRKELLPLLPIVLLLLAGCVDNKLYLDDTRGSGQKGEFLVYFYPRMESNFVITKTLSPFPKNCKAQIFAFSSGGNQQSVASPVYRSLSAGTLSPTQSPMMLVRGEYNFYAVSTRNDSLPPTFSDNVATNLRNGLDYLWCGITDQTIDANGTTLPITFTHSATQLVVEIKNEDEATPMTALVSARCQKPQSGDSVAWRLSTGVITPSGSISDSLDSMKCSGFTASCIMLPVAAGVDSLIFEAVVSQSGQQSLCTVGIPVPSAGLQGGHSYEFEMIFKEGALKPALVRVLPWNEEVISDDVGAYGEEKD